MAELIDDSKFRSFESSSLPTGEGIVIDIGTGDGSFVYHCARKHPRKFYIGIDANPRPLEKISEKVHRNPRKGGLANVLFLQASVEDLPAELDAVADEVHVHFPWGSLLGGVAGGGNITVLKNLRRLCLAGALLEVVIGLDSERDKAELDRLKIPQFDLIYIDNVLAGYYRRAGFEIVERGQRAFSEWPDLHSSWAKRLKGRPGRQLTYLIAQAITLEDRAFG